MASERLAEGREEVKKKRAIARHCCAGLILATSLLALACAKSADQTSPAGNGPIIAANELAAISQLRAIASAESTYQATTGSGSYGTLEQLIASQSINQQLNNGKNRGYRFEVRVISGSLFEAVATPIQYGITGLKSFYMNSNGSEIHGADKKGAQATSSDPAL